MKSRSTRLEDGALGLLAFLLFELLDVGVLPNPDTSQAQRHKTSTSDDHFPLHICISTNNGITLWCTIKERTLDCDAAKDSHVVCLAGLRQTLEQLSGKNVVPHGTSDGVSDGRTETTEEAPDCVDDGDLLVTDGNHDGELSAGGEEARSETNKNLSESEDTRVGGWVPERYQQGGTEQDDRYTDSGCPLEVTGTTDPIRDKWAEGGRSE